MIEKLYYSGEKDILLWGLCTLICIINSKGNL